MSQYFFIVLSHFDWNKSDLIIYKFKYTFISNLNPFVINLFINSDSKGVKINVFLK